MSWRTVVWLPILVLGCDAAPSDRETFRRTVLALQGQVEALHADVKNLEMDLFMLRATTDQWSSAIFDPANIDGPRRLNTIGGSLLIALKKTTSHLDGLQVTCDMGNLGTSVIHGFTITAQWGPRRDRKAVNGDYEQWKAQLQKTTKHFDEVLHPGKWHEIAVVLAPAKASEFGYLEVSFEAGESDWAGDGSHDA